MWCFGRLAAQPTTTLTARPSSQLVPSHSSPSFLLTSNTSFFTARPSSQLVLFLVDVHQATLEVHDTLLYLEIHAGERGCEAWRAPWKQVWRVLNVIERLLQVSHPRVETHLPC